MNAFIFNEKYLSQLPAMQLLMGLGYQYLNPISALQERNGKTSNVLLEEILLAQLKKLNRIDYKGAQYLFSEANIQEAIRKLKHIKHERLQKTNQAIYDLITLGATLEQPIEGSSKSFTLRYIDWKNPQNNLFHLVPEFTVERARSVETVRLDIVLFVNGIPLGVIECKSPKIEVEEAISQNIRNQNDEYIPKLFTYVQLVMGVNKNAVRYGTAGTKKAFWSIWQELEDQEDSVKALINSPLSGSQKETLYSGEFASARSYFDDLENEGEREVTEQDKAIYSLCRPERLLELIYRYTLFEYGEKKIARYQQFFVVRSALNRVKRLGNDGKRRGGIIWHTQGSGKSLTMVMLARVLVLDAAIANPRLLLVTDRDDLDKQLGNTFEACGLTKKRATSGRNLVKHLREKVGIITSLIHKFDKGWLSDKYVDTSSDLIVLVDESHRTHFGELAARMRRMLPNACYIAFTGTPLLKEDKNSFAKFGSLIEPHYSIKKALKDKAVLPLLYEGRYVDMEQNQEAIDLWFERHTVGLTDAQKADLKKKYARAKMLNRAEQVIYMRAFDISGHFRANWQGTTFKAQLVAPTKAAAIKYYQYLNELKQVSSEVVISAPDTREGHEEVDAGSTDEVGKFWNKMMRRFGSEEEYTKQIITKFKEADEPEILIVVDKLLTGFDAPRNTLLYLCKTIREHTLLQAIARVNRLHEGKDFGYIVDYANVLGELDKALEMYDALDRFDQEDLEGTLTSVHEEVSQLPQCHSHLWDLFKEVKNKKDEEKYEKLLADDEKRQEFYQHLLKYSKILGLALSTDKFFTETAESKIKEYKQDLKRFMSLRQSVQLRYAEKIDFGAYENKIKKLLDTHIQANQVYPLNEPVNIFDKNSINQVMEGNPVYNSSKRTDAAKADTIAHATKRIITEKMDEDPAFYQKFSELIENAITAFKEDWISDLEYLNRVMEIQDELVSGGRDDIPDSIRDNDDACAFFGILKLLFREQFEISTTDEILCETALAIQEALNRESKVDFWNDEQAINKTKDKIDDFFYEILRDKYAIELSDDQMNEIIEKTIQIARNRQHS